MKRKIDVWALFPILALVLLLGLLTWLGVLSVRMNDQGPSANAMAPRWAADILSKNIAQDGIEALDGYDSGIWPDGDENHLSAVALDGEGNVLKSTGGPFASGLTKMNLMTSPYSRHFPSGRALTKTALDTAGEWKTAASR